MMVCSCLFTRDFTCLVVGALFFWSNLLNIAISGKKLRAGVSLDYEKFSALDPDYLQELHSRQKDMQGLTVAANLFNAVAWFFFCVPVIQIAWIMSRGGRRKLHLHVMMAALVVGASIAELMSRLLQVGMKGVTQWLVESFNMNDWLGEGSGDGLGYRVLAVVSMVTQGVVVWIDAFEWLALFGILFAIFISVRTDKSDEPSFSHGWATFGLFIGFLSLFDFVADVLRVLEWRTFMMMALVISFVNTIIMLPIWLFMLARQLPSARAPFDEYDPSSQKKLNLNAIEDDIV